MIWHNPDNAYPEPETASQRVARWGTAIRNSKIGGVVEKYGGGALKILDRLSFYIVVGLGAVGAGVIIAETLPQNIELKDIIKTIGGSDAPPSDPAPAVTQTAAAVTAPPAPTEGVPKSDVEKTEPYDRDKIFGPKPGVAGEDAPAESPITSAPPAEKTMPETVAEYALTDGDGITQAVMKLKAEWPQGVEMPTWLQNIHSTQDVAEWARLNHFYTPEQVKDSILMYKGDVLSIDAQGELVLKNPDGTYNVITDRDGRAMTDPIPNRDFSDSVPTELPDARASELLTQTAVINNPPVESFAKQNPWPVDSTEYRAWEGMRDFITTYAPGDSWKTSTLSVSEYLQKMKFTN